MENRLLEAINEMTNESFLSIGEARVHYTSRELFDYFLEYEGIVGYTNTILSAMSALGFNLESENEDEFDFILEA